MTQHRPDERPGTAAVSETQTPIPAREPRLTHVREDGTAHMVDVSEKAVTSREATAQAVLVTRPDVVDLLSSGDLPKGDALAVARVAGIMAAKRTPDLVPLCHPLPISKVSVDLAADPALPGIRVTATVRTTGRTGVEMEALTAVSVACLTVYDMLKAAEKSMVLQDIRLMRKSGGKSGDYEAGA